MAALRSRWGHYIFALWFLLSSSSSSFLFPRLISAVGDWMSTILPHIWCGLSANLECRSEMCCTRLAGNAGPKNSPKNRHLGTIPQLCRAISSQLRHISTFGKKFLSSNISSTCPYFGFLAAEIVSLVWDTPATGFASWQHYCTALQYCASVKLSNFAALNRRRHLYSAGRPSRWALVHISSFP